MKGWLAEIAVMPKRSSDELRPFAITPHYLEHPEGSVLVECGDTKVICTASVDENVPRWMRGKGAGWVTAEYDMLPRATGTRRQRDSRRGKVNGRTQEISRLIGRALRAAVDMEKLGERQINIDCDVIQADGGTRCTSITGALVALGLAINNLVETEVIPESALVERVAAISVGVLGGEVVLDLDYSMDSRAGVDMNVVMTESGQLIEIQGTGEDHAFSREQLDQMLGLAFSALPKLLDLQERALKVPAGEPQTTVR